MPYHDGAANDAHMHDVVTAPNYDAVHEVNKLAAVDRKYSTTYSVPVFFRRKRFISFQTKSLPHRFLGSFVRSVFHA